VLGCGLMKKSVGADRKFSKPVRPRLVLWITVDMLRADAISMCQKNFGKAGFHRFIDRGLWYKNARFRQGVTLTSVGHASLFTGADPSHHGIIGNNWVDKETGERIYCVQDDRHHILNEEPVPNEGRSPFNLFCSTVGDELMLATGLRSRVYSVSVKDRGAIIPGGHLGKAYWFSTKSGGFVTSSYYADAYPSWIAEWNSNKPADDFKGSSWDLLLKPQAYLFAELDHRPEEAGYGGMGRIFPHRTTLAMPLGHTVWNMKMPC